MALDESAVSELFDALAVGEGTDLVRQFYLDATYIHVRDDALGQVVSRAVVIATGITASATLTATSPNSRAEHTEDRAVTSNTPGGILHP